jgi:hypothetical protein
MGANRDVVISPDFDISSVVRDAMTVSAEGEGATTRSTGLLPRVAPVLAASFGEFLRTAFVLLDTTSVRIEVSEAYAGTGIATFTGLLIYLRCSGQIAGDDARLSAASFECLGNDAARVHVAQFARSLVELECLRLISWNRASSE